MVLLSAGEPVPEEGSCYTLLWRSSNECGFCIPTYFSSLILEISDLPPGFIAMYAKLSGTELLEAFKLKRLLALAKKIPRAS